MAQIKRVFLDANILFTAAYNPTGLAAELIFHQNKLKLKALSSTYAVGEALHNLQLKAPQALSHLKEILKKIEIVQTVANLEDNPLKLPLADIPIFQAACQTKSTHLLSGDKKAFGKWMSQPKKTFGLCIQSIRQFFDSLG